MTNAALRRGSLLNKKIAFALVACFAAGFASAETRVVVSGGIATLDVPTDVSPYTMVADDAAAILASGVTEFRKTGAGTLVANASAASLATFAGTIRIQNGVYQVAAAGDLGADAISIYVEATDDAAGQIKATAGTDFKNRRFYIAGIGPDGNGAIYGATTSSITTKSLTLTADARLVFSGTVTLNGTVDLQYRTLDLEPTGGYKAMNGSATIKNGGHIICDRNGSYTESGINFGWTYEASADATLTAGGFMNSPPSVEKTPWKWIVTPKLNTRMNSGSANYPFESFKDTIISETASMYGGPVELRVNQTHGNPGATDRWQIFGYKGAVSGSGNITMSDAQYQDRTWFKLGSANPDWTGSISVKRNYSVCTNQNDKTKFSARANGLALFADGALTQKTLELKNAELYLGGSDAIQHLPDIVTEGYGRFWGTVTGSVDTITKTGNDDLLIENIVRANELSVEAGSVTISNGVVDATVAALRATNWYRELGAIGLVQGMYWNTNRASKVTKTDYPPFDEVIATNVTVNPMGPQAAFVDGNNAWWCENAAAGTPEKIYIDYRMYAYEGYVWNRNATNETWHFASSISSYSKLWIDDMETPIVEKSNGKYADQTNAVVKSAKVMTPGPHKVRIQLWPHQGVSTGTNETEYNPDGSVKRTNARAWNKPYGIAVDRTGAATANLLATNVWENNVVGWELLSDYSGTISLGGSLTKTDAATYALCDGSLLTTTNVTNEALAEERVTAYRETLDWPELLPSIKTLRFATGTSLNIDIDETGRFEVTDVVGFPAVAGGRVYVKGEWTMDAASLQAGQKVVSDNAIAFADGSKIVIDDTGLKAHPEGLALFSAAGGIVGTPSVVFTKRPARAKNWRVENRSGTLYLVGGTAGVAVVVQ